MTRQLDVAEASLRFGSGGVCGHPTRHQLSHARLEMERDLRVHILLGESGAVNGEPEESASAGRKHRGIPARRYDRVMLRVRQPFATPR
jgi:hypothetical protein